MLKTTYQMGEPGFHAQAKAALVEHYHELGQMPTREVHPDGLWDIEAWDSVNSLFLELGKVPKEAVSALMESANPLMKLRFDN